jgi:hypothetical protein
MGSSMGMSLSGVSGSSEDSSVTAWEDTSSKAGDDVEVIAMGLAIQSTMASVVCSATC